MVERRNGERHRSDARIVTSEIGNGSDPPGCAERDKALETLAAVSHRRELLEIEAMSVVSSARRAGATWAEVGVALRASEQAVSRKYGPLLRTRLPGGPFGRNRNESATF